MNRVSEIGRLSKDAELTFLPGNGTAVLKFPIAVSDGFGDNKKSYFFDVVLFGKSAENLSKYISKGSQVGVTGKLVQEKWEDKDGNNRYSIKIYADTFAGVTLLGGNNSGNSNYVGNPQGSSNSGSDDEWGGTPLDGGDMPF